MDSSVPREHRTQGTTSSVFNKYLLIQIVKRLVQNIVPRGDMIDPPQCSGQDEGSDSQTTVWFSFNISLSLKTFDNRRLWNMYRYICAENVTVMSACPLWCQAGLCPGVQ